MIRQRWASWLLRSITPLLLGLVLWAFWLEPASLTVHQQRIVVPLQGNADLRIAVLSDLHVGSPFNGLDNLRRVIDRTNSLHPDLVCILGDFVIQGVRGGTFVPPEVIAPEMRRLQSTYGTFAVLGNHDDWLNHDRVAAAVTANSVHIVEEDATRLETKSGSLWLAGVSDYWMGRHDVATALSKITDASPVILMSHNPDVFPTVPARVALTLAGHTHGGQVRFPFLGAPIVPSEFGQRYAAGYINEGGRQMYVSTGIGTSILPVRFRVPPSITLLTLSNFPSAR